VLDFGLAKMGPDAVDPDSDMPTAHAEDPLTSPGTTVGTVNYMSPEQVRGEELDARTDLFSAGVLLYEMATGRQPFAGNTSGMVFTAIMTTEPTPARQLSPAVPEEFERVITRMLQKDRELRYQTARDLLAELRLVQRDSGSRQATGPSAGAAPGGTQPTKQLPAAQPPVADSAPSASTPSQTIIVKETPQWIWAAIAVVALLALGASWLALRRDAAPSDTTTTTAPATESVSAASDTKVIVVLPFENLGAAEDEYFAQGVSDEISGRLGTIDGLDVISRNSAQRYADTDKTVQQIGEELDVSHILEGRVRWAKGGDGASRVLITPELIRVADDTQVWSASLDREIDDIFALQGEIAEQVAEGLGVELGETEIAGLSSRPTDSTEAYQAYLRGHEISRTGYSSERTRTAVQMFELAVELDPRFVSAWAALSRRLGEAYYNGYYRPSEEAAVLARIKEAVDRALELAPDDPKAQLALGYYHYYGLGEFKRALAVFEGIADERPNDTDALEASGWVRRRLGLWDDFFATFDRLLALDPSAAALMAEVADTHAALRQFDEAAALYDRALALAPDMNSAWEARALVELYGKGSIAGAREILDRWPSDDAGRYLDVLGVERDWPGYLAAAESLEEAHMTARVVRRLSLGIAHERLGNDAAARQAFEAALEILPDDVGNDPQEFLAFAQGLAEAALGNTEAARRTTDSLRPFNPDDVFQSPVHLQRKALLYARLGMADHAIELIEGLLKTPYLEPGMAGYPVTRHWLRLGPEWDRLREDPRFQALIDG
jgi:TolB-like protein/Tfp pilus assembly protein PilF